MGVVDRMRGLEGPDVLVTGTPRSGTTLTCHLLNRLPDVVALHEPLEPHRFFGDRDPERVRGRVERFLRKTRKSLLRDGTAPSLQVDGAVPDQHLAGSAAPGGLRQKVGGRGEVHVGKDLPRGFTLAVKHPALFTALLPDLLVRWPVVAVIRNPLSVLASWNSVDLPVQRGRTPTGEGLDDTLRADLARIEDVLDRQIHILQWFLGAYARHLPPAGVVRYEEIVASGGSALEVIAPAAAALREDLDSRNRNRLYDGEAMARIGERLLASQGPVWDFYDRGSVESLLAGGAAAS